MQRAKISPVLQHLTQHTLGLLQTPCRMTAAGPEPAHARVSKALGNPRACEAGASAAGAPADRTR